MDYLSTKKRTIITGIFTIYTLSLILWDYTHGGVPAHNLLHDGNLPSISNWWGMLIIPIITWVTLSRISKRNPVTNGDDSVKYVALRFLLAATLGVIISILFFSESDAVNYLMITLFVVGFFYPIYKGEFFLGYVMSTIFAFGSFIPTLGGLILMGILFIFYKIGRVITTIIKQKKAI